MWITYMILNLDYLRTESALHFTNFTKALQWEDQDLLPRQKYQAHEETARSTTMHH